MLERNFLRFGKYLVPIVAIVIAVNQLYHANFDHLTPWKGGGFGMFSSIRSINNRVVFVTPNQIADSLDGYNIPMSSFVLREIGWTDERYRSFRSFPSEAELRRLGQDLLLLSYQLDDNKRLNLLENRLGKATDHISWFPSSSLQEKKKSRAYYFDSLTLTMHELSYDSEKEEVCFEQLFEIHVSK